MPARDLAALEADAWTRVEQRATPAHGQAGQNTTPEARPPASQQIAAEQTTPDRAHPDDEASQPEIADRQAAAAAAARYAERLEAAYQHAFTAIETLVTAIEHVQQLRGQEHVWDHANTLGVAPKRPEPWHVRAAFDDQLRKIATVAVARKLLTLCYYGLRDGEIRCLQASGPGERDRCPGGARP